MAEPVVEDPMAPPTVAHANLAARITQERYVAYSHLNTITSYGVRQIQKAEEERDKIDVRELKMREILGEKDKGNEFVDSEDLRRDDLVVFLKTLARYEEMLEECRVGQWMTDSMEKMNASLKNLIGLNKNLRVVAEQSQKGF